MSTEVYIVDDEALLRRMLKRACCHAGMQAMTFADGPEFLAASASLKPGVVLLDMHMPRLTGVQVLAALGPRLRLFPVLIMTSYGDIALAVEAMKAGAADFVEKPFHLPGLIERIRILQTENQSRGQKREALANAEAQLAVLTAREREVGELLSRGCSNKEIARSLSISPRTAEAHRARLMKKLGVSNIADLVRTFLSVEVEGA